MAEMTEVPICVNCIKNSAHPADPDRTVYCYWEEHEGLDIFGDTCKYFNRGSIKTIVPVRHCFQVGLSRDTLWMKPAYAVSFRGHDYIADIEPEGSKYDERDQINGCRTFLYDASLDLVMDSFEVRGTLDDFISEHKEIMHESFISDAMARNYPAMGAAKKLLMKRLIKLVEEARQLHDRDESCKVHPGGS